MTAKRDTRTRFAAFSLSLVISLLAVLVAAAPADAKFPGTADKGDISIKLSLLVTGGTMTAGEPLLARVEITNLTSNKLLLLDGNSDCSRTYFEIRDKRGKVLAATPLPSSVWDADTFVGMHEIRPHGTYSHYWILSALYSFPRPGDYRVVARQLGDSDAVLAEASAPLRVTHTEVKKLEARIEELMGGTGVFDCDDMPPSIRTRGVYSVRHDCALPCLKQMAIDWNNSNAILAMRRIGSPKALAIVQELLDSPRESLAKAARHAMEERLDSKFSIVWDMGM